MTVCRLHTRGSPADGCIAAGKLSGGIVGMFGTHKSTAVTCTRQLPALSSATVGSGTAKAVW